MNIRRFRALFDAGASYAEIAAECGCDWRTVKKYLAADAPSVPPVGSSRAGTQPRVIDSFTEVIDAWLRSNIKLRGTVIHERLVAEYGYQHSYQRVKMYLQEARPRIAAELAAGDENPLSGLHRRFEVIPGAQAQVDWGEEGALLADAGIGTVYSFHMTLSHSRDPFCCFTDSTDLATFWDCHRRAFAHFGGVPHTIVYDRTKTVVQRHVAPRRAVPLHPEAAAFAEHYGFTIDVLAAYRPTGKGRVERQVEIVRNHVVAGRSFDSPAELDRAFAEWLPIRRAQVHRTHGEVIAVRAEADRAALLGLPPTPYVVAEQHLRTVGKDCLVSFESSLYSVPARLVRPHQKVQVRVTGESVVIHTLATDGATVLAVHPRAPRKGSWMVDAAHWDGLPDGHTRATIRDGGPHTPLDVVPLDSDVEPNPLSALLARNSAAQVPVARRALSSYDTATQLPDEGPEVTLW
ncbi:IS21 family transposase [Haloechinothrix salitolerans]|uniref:IS21 family transposase n=1 Tax=Haloechinothrix salitolerans TaxID=926830 RepID=A0ABW2BZI6_9PSEU